MFLKTRLFRSQKLLSEQTATDTCLLVEGIAYEDLKKLVHFAYNGSVKVSRENFGSFLVAAELLGMKWTNQVELYGGGEPYSNAATKRVVFADITNTNAAAKRRKPTKAKKCCKKSKRAEKHDLVRVLNAVDIEECIADKENQIAEVDENTFYSALGLKKNTVSVPSAATVARKSKSIPNLIKINRAAGKMAAELQCDNAANVFVSEMNTVYIEDKNLSFLNEVCIRESNIEIECDVLDASSEFVIEKDGAAVANVVELRESKFDRSLECFVCANVEQAVLTRWGRFKFSTICAYYQNTEHTQNITDKELIIVSFSLFSARKELIFSFLFFVSDIIQAEFFEIDPGRPFGVLFTQLFGEC